MRPYLRNDPAPGLLVPQVADRQNSPSTGHGAHLTKPKNLLVVGPRELVALPMHPCAAGFDPALRHPSCIRLLIGVH